MNRSINPDFMEAAFSELEKRGASCIADVGPDDLAVGLRHMFLDAARDLMVNYPGTEDAVFGEKLCEAAEHIQAAIEVVGFGG